MRVRDHVLISTAGAALAAPLIGRGALGVWAGGVLIDADHYAWYCLRQRRLSLPAAVRFFNQADPPQHPATRALHAPRCPVHRSSAGLRQRRLLPVALGMGLHAALDAGHQATWAGPGPRPWRGMSTHARHAGRPRRRSPPTSGASRGCCPRIGPEPDLAVRPMPRGRARAQDRTDLVDLATVARGRTARVRTVALRVTIGLAVGAVLVFTFLRLVNVGAVYQRLMHINLGIALLCGATFLAAYVVRALRWRCLLTPSQVSIRRAVAIYQIAIFLNWLLPVRGGEIAMSLLLRHSDGIPVNQSLAAVSMDKAMDLVPAVGLLALLPFVGLHLSRSLWLVLAGAMAAARSRRRSPGARGVAAGPGRGPARSGRSSAPAGPRTGSHRAVHHRVHRHPRRAHPPAADPAHRRHLHRCRPGARRALLPAGVQGRGGNRLPSWSCSTGTPCSTCRSSCRRRPARSEATSSSDC